MNTPKKHALNIAIELIDTQMSEVRYTPQVKKELETIRDRLKRNLDILSGTYLSAYPEYEDCPF